MLYYFQACAIARLKGFSMLMKYFTSVFLFVKLWKGIIFFVMCLTTKSHLQVWIYMSILYQFSDQELQELHIMIKMGPDNEKNAKSYNTS